MPVLPLPRTILQGRSWPGCRSTVSTGLKIITKRGKEVCCLLEHWVCICVYSTTVNLPKPGLQGHTNHHPLIWLY